MTDIVYKQLKEALDHVGVQFEDGLTTKEISEIENTYGFKFPPDLIEFIAYALPISERFINWRSEDPINIKSRLAWPLEGMCFDIKNNAFWVEEWGEKPDNLDEAYEIARKAVSNAPKLIPIFSHRYIPDSPSEEGNPIFSVHQTDIIYYGTNLFNYLDHEFDFGIDKDKQKFEGNFRTIEFWSNLVG